MNTSETLLNLKFYSSYKFRLISTRPKFLLVGFAAADGFVVQTGDPEGPAEGFIDPSTEKTRTIPLELMVDGEKAPFYGATLEVIFFPSLSLSSQFCHFYWKITEKKNLVVFTFWIGFNMLILEDYLGIVIVQLARLRKVLTCALTAHLTFWLLFCFPASFVKSVKSVFAYVFI